MRGIFITGTDTNVGKTVVAAAVMLRYRDEATLRYWKPVQTGIRDSRFGIHTSGDGVSSDDDSTEVARLSGASEDQILRCGVQLPDPVSPHLAARRAGIRITVHSVVETLHSADLKVRAARSPESRIPSPESRPRWVVEGAGGALVPLNERETMADLMQALDLPVLIAARSSLGTINHTCMTIEVLRRRMLRVAGVVMVGEPNDENRLAIERYGAAEVIAQMPRFNPLMPEALQAWVHAEFDRSGVLFVGGLR
jgi:dethiobiotin synthase